MQQRIDLNEYRVAEGTPEQDQNFGQMMKRFLVKNPRISFSLQEVDLRKLDEKDTYLSVCRKKSIFRTESLC